MVVKIYKKNIMHRLIFILALFPIRLTAFGQLIAKEELKDFAPSVVAKVYEIASTTSLSKSQQKKLAILFEETDSLIAKTILSGGEIGKIDSLKKRNEISMFDILKAESLNEYYSKKNSSQALAEAKAFSKVLGEKYQMEPQVRQQIEKLYAQQRIFINNAVNSSLQDSIRINDRVYKVIANFDSLITKFIFAAASRKFIEEKSKLIAGLSPTNKELLVNKFIHSVYLHPELNYSDNLLTALRFVTTDPQVYQSLFNIEIENRASIESLRTIAKMRSEKLVTSEGGRFLQPIIARKEKELAAVSISTTNRKIADSLYASIEQKYKPLEDSILTRDGSGIPVSHISVALQYKKPLALREGQIDSLVTLAIIHKNMRDSFLAKDPLGKFDSKAFESSNLSSLLSEHQYNKVLIIKNRPIAESDAEKDWDEIKLRGLSANFSKEIALKKLTDYYLAKWCAYYRYGHDKLLQLANVKAIENAMPSELRSLRAARKQNNVLAAQNSLQYQW
jgi:hypothetical protein